MIRKKERARIEPFPSHDAYVTDEAIAHFVGIHVTTVWSWVKKGILPQPLKLSKGITRWQAIAVRRALDAQAVSPV